MKTLGLQQDESRAATCDIMHFEVLGSEAEHLEKEAARAVDKGELPACHRGFITPRTVQEYLKDNPSTRLPGIITIKTHSLLPESYLAGTRKSVVTRSAGYDHLEHLTETANIASLRDYCVNAVAQTAMKFLYAAAGELNLYAKNTASFTRENSRAFVELGPHKLLTVYGAGKIGKRVHELGEANGLSVQAVDLRQDYLKKTYGAGMKFVSKETAIISSDIIINAMNLTRDRESAFYNVGYFSEEYLSRAKPGLIFINVSRGETAPEAVLWNLYRTGRIMGIGLDVFSAESEFAALLKGDTAAGPDHAAARLMVQAALNRSANVYVQPHQGFNSDVAVQAKARETIKHLVAWHRNKGNRFDEQLPYY